LKALQSLLDQLLSLLRKYPKDLPLLLECFAQIGKSHGQLLGADTIHQLLFNYDRRFLPEKWRLNDARCTNEPSIVLQLITNNPSL
jgi:hypothetical protein